MSSGNVLKQEPRPFWVPSSPVLRGHERAGMCTGRAKEGDGSNDKWQAERPSFLVEYYMWFRKVFTALYYKATECCSYISSLQVLICLPGLFPHHPRKCCLWKIGWSACAGSYWWRSSPVTPLTRLLSQLISSKPQRCCLDHNIKQRK